MSSSTSSSENPAGAPLTAESAQLRAPSFGLRWLWIMATAGLLLLGGWEGWLRSRGVPARGTPEQKLWSRRYADVIEGRARLAAIGSSRVRCDLVPGDLSKAAGLRPEQVACLGLNASSPLPVLSDLRQRAQAGELAFRGLLVVEAPPLYLFGRSEDAEALTALHQFELAGEEPEVIPDLLRGPDWAAPRLFNERATPMNLLLHLQIEWRGKAISDAFGLPDTPTRRMHEDGWEEILGDALSPEDRAAADAALAASIRAEAHPFNEMEFSALLEELEGAVRDLEAVGVRVLFLRMPSGGQVAAAEEELFPRARCWEALAARLPGRCLHFADAPELSGFLTVDGSHLAGADAKVFSDRLGRLLQSRLPGRQAP